MPIYEFYCPDCHVVFQFFAASVNTRKRPDCPRCERPGLDRQMSRFATPRQSSEGVDDTGLDGLDEGRMQRAMSELASEAGSVDEQDPRQAVQMMRRLTEMAGLNMGEGMQEAMRRIEAGEDPEEVEAALGGLLDGEDPIALGTSGGAPRSTRARPPERDEKLHRL